MQEHALTHREQTLSEFLSPVPFTRNCNYFFNVLCFILFAEIIIPHTSN